MKKVELELTQQMVENAIDRVELESKSAIKNLEVNRAIIKDTIKMIQAIKEVEVSEDGKGIKKYYADVLQNQINQLNLELKKAEARNKQHEPFYQEVMANKEDWKYWVDRKYLFNAISIFDEFTIEEKELMKKLGMRNDEQ